MLTQGTTPQATPAPAPVTAIEVQLPGPTRPITQAEIGVIRGFMPTQMGEEEVGAAIEEAVAATGAASMRDMGKVMAYLKERYAGKLDFGKAGALVKDRLG